MASGVGPCAAVDQVMATPDIRAQIFGAVPLLERVQLRGACHDFKSAVDESLEVISELFREDISDVASKAGGLDWLLLKCPNLRTLSFYSRTAHQLPRDEREQAIQGNFYNPGTAKQSLLGLGHCRQLRSLTLAGSLDVDDNVMMVVAAACRDLERLDVRNTRITDAGVTAVASHCRQLKELLVGSFFSEVTDESLQRIAKRCRHLEQLVIVGTSITDAGVSAIARRCPKLRHLGIQGDGDSSVTDAGIATVAAHCPQLEYFAIENTGRGITDASVITIAKHCPTLRGLYVRYCPVTGVGLRAVADGCRQLESLHTVRCNIPSSVFANLAMRCPLLRRFKVSGCGSVGEVHDDVLLALGRSCPELRKLDIVADEVSDAGIAALARGCPSLEHLKFGIFLECNVSNVGITAIAHGCPQLRHLTLPPDVTDVGVRAIARGCPQLRHVSLLLCGHVTDDGMIALAQNSPQLRELELIACNKVTDASLRAVGEHCRVLEWLSCYLTEVEVTDASTGALARNCTELRNISWRGCRLREAAFRVLVESRERWDMLRVSDVDCPLDDCMAAISRNCTRLSGLSLESCPMVTDQTLATVLSGPAAATLLNLNLSRNEGITDDALLTVARACPILHDLDVGYCSNVTDVGIMAIAQGCQRLTKLNVDGTKVTRDGLNSFEHLQYVW